MIQISPPSVQPYAPAVSPIAFVDVLLQRSEATGRIGLFFNLYDANKNPIQYVRSAIPQVTQAQLDTFVALGATAGDTLDQDISRRALPIVASNFGLNGTVMSSAAASTASPATKKTRATVSAPAAAPAAAAPAAAPAAPAKKA